MSDDRGQQFRELEELEEPALALNNEGVRSGARGEHAAALVALRSAVQLCRKLVLAHPDVETFHESFLAILRNLSGTQRELRLFPEALAGLEEGVQLCRARIAAYPDTSVRNLPSCLNSLGVLQKAMGLRDAAIASTEEAVEVLWPSFLAKPRELSRDLDVFMTNLRDYHREQSETPPPELLARVRAYYAALGMPLEPTVP